MLYLWGCHALRSIVLWNRLAAGFSAIYGGVSTEYQIEMSLDDEGLHRSVSGWQERPDNGRTIVQSLPENEIWSLGADYGHKGTTDDEGRVTFSGVFRDATPSDLGGAGSLEVWETSLGTLTAYSERIRGSDDLAARWETRVEKIDRFCELMGGWAQENAVDAGQGDEISEFINGPLRDDLKNISMLGWTLAAGGPWTRERFEELVFRLFQYGVEHGYVGASDYPRLIHASNRSAQAGLDVLLEILDRKRDKGTVPLRDIIPALQPTDALQASLSEYLNDTPEADAMRREAKEGEPVNVAGIPSELLFASLASGPLPGLGEHVAIRFETGHEPFTTNGVWDPDSRTVAWEHIVEGRGETPIGVLPSHSYAMWAVPDAAFQESHFGRVVFDGERLATYITWHEGLTEIEVDEWGRFLAGLTPTDDLKTEFDLFRFEGEPRDTEEEALLSDIPRQLLQAALDAAE